MEVPIIWMPLYIMDYRADTRRFTAEEKCAYLELITYYWEHGTLPNDDFLLAKIAGVSERTWQKCRPTLQHVFQIKEDSWHHERLTQARAKAALTSTKNKERARKAARKRWDKEIPGMVESSNPIPSTCLEHAHAHLQLQSDSQSQSESEEQTAIFPSISNEIEGNNNFSPDSRFSVLSDSASTEAGSLKRVPRQENREGKILKTRKKAAPVERPASVPPDIWADFIALRQSKRVPLSATALKGLENEAAKAQKDLGEALSICCLRGWVGFQAQWLEAPAGTSKFSPKQANSHSGFKDLDYNVGINSDGTFW